MAQQIVQADAHNARRLSQALEHVVKFMTPNRDMEFEIPDDWWSFCEMPGFQANGGGFYPIDLNSYSAVEIVPLNDIEPPVRKEGVPKLRKYKLVPILLGFLSPECALPPAQILRSGQPGGYQYQVHNGYHRFYASVAVGYSKLPVTIIERDVL